jgi:hypothetical protein
VAGDLTRSGITSASILTDADLLSFSAVEEGAVGVGLAPGPNFRARAAARSSSTAVLVAGDAVGGGPMEVFLGAGDAAEGPVGALRLSDAPLRVKPVGPAGATGGTEAVDRVALGPAGGPVGEVLSPSTVSGGVFALASTSATAGDAGVALRLLSAGIP